MSEYTNPNIDASALVSTAIIDCLLQTLMKKGILLPSEINEIFEAAGLLLQQQREQNAQVPLSIELAIQDIQSRLGAGS